VIEGAESADEKETDKTFLTGTNVDQQKNDFDNFENSQALVEQNLLNNPTYNRRRGVNQAA